MRRTEIELSKCKPGMKVAQTCYNTYGAALIEQEAVLDQVTIDHLIRIGVRTIRIYEEEVIPTENKGMIVLQNYEHGIEDMKSVFQNLSTGKALEDKKVKTVVENIVHNIGENRDVVKCLNQIREVDDYTYMHSVNVSMLCMLIGKWLKYNENDLKNLVEAGLLHDIGKVKISPEVVQFKEDFTQTQVEEYRKHVLYGYEIAAATQGIHEDTKSGILFHHEKNDGSGFPKGCKENDIHEFAKIISIADIFDNMTIRVKNKPRQTPFAVFDIFETKVIHSMDYRIYNTFMTNISIYYIGAKVMLNSGEIGEVIYMYPGHLSKPIVRVGSQFKDLLMQTDYKITNMF